MRIGNAHSYALAIAWPLCGRTAGHRLDYAQALNATCKATPLSVDTLVTDRRRDSTRDNAQHNSSLSMRTRDWRHPHPHTRTRTPLKDTLRLQTIPRTASGQLPFGMCAQASMRTRTATRKFSVLRNNRIPHRHCPLYTQYASNAQILGSIDTCCVAARETHTHTHTHARAIAKWARVRPTHVLRPISLPCKSNGAVTSHTSAATHTRVRPLECASECLSRHGRPQIPRRNLTLCKGAGAIGRQTQTLGCGATLDPMKKALRARRCHCPRRRCLMRAGALHSARPLGAAYSGQ